MAALRRQGLSVEVPRSVVGAGLLWGGSSSLRQMCSCAGVCSPAEQAGRSEGRCPHPWFPGYLLPTLSTFTQHVTQEQAHGWLWSQPSHSRHN